MSGAPQELAELILSFAGRIDPSLALDLAVQAYGIGVCAGLSMAKDEVARHIEQMS